MRLLSVRTRRLENFQRGEIPKYLILSHTWASDPTNEISFDDVCAQDSSPILKSAWHTKVRSFCDIARDRGYEWVWIDTCCIDKGSSAELTEALNSMYKWYHRAEGCFAYLEDVSNLQAHGSLDKLSFKPKSFTRGWTLQELVAPRTLEMFDTDWQRIGSRSELAESLRRLTGIPTPVFRGIDPHSFTVDERIRWAGSRQTSKEEDLAYSLLGLLNVSMPIIYGEGQERAMRRLKREIDLEKAAPSTASPERSRKYNSYALSANSRGLFTGFVQVLRRVALQQLLGFPTVYFFIVDLLTGVIIGRILDPDKQKQDINQHFDAVDLIIFMVSCYLTSLTVYTLAAQCPGYFLNGETTNWFLFYGTFEFCLFLIISVLHNMFGREE